MSNDKMREEFEASYRNEALNGPCGKGTFDEAAFSMRDGQYIIGMVQAAWWGWQASRAALVVELPIEPSMSMYVSHREVRAARDMHARFRLAIASAGVGVKP